MSCKTFVAITAAFMMFTIYFLCSGSLKAPRLVQWAWWSSPSISFIPWICYHSLFVTDKSSKCYLKEGRKEKTPMPKEHFPFSLPLFLFTRLCICLQSKHTQTADQIWPVKIIHPTHSPFFPQLTHEHLSTLNHSTEGLSVPSMTLGICSWRLER